MGQRTCPLVPLLLQMQSLTASSMTPMKYSSTAMIRAQEKGYSKVAPDTEVLRAIVHFALVALPINTLALFC